MTAAGSPIIVTPSDIAKTLGISPKTLRHWLRTYRSGCHEHYARWVFTAAEADVIVARCRARL